MVSEIVFWDTVMSAYSRISGLAMMARNHWIFRGSKRSMRQRHKTALDFPLSLSENAIREQAKDPDYLSFIAGELTREMEAFIKADFDTLGRWP